MLRVAFQGERGAYGEEAIEQHWRSDAEPVPSPSFDAALRAVASGSVEAAVLPVENSVVGSITASLEALETHRTLRVVDETVVDVRHLLLAPAGASLRTVRQVESHPVALAQCQRYFAERPHIDLRESEDTAGAARAVAEAGDLTRAAIAGTGAAHRYGLIVLATHIADRLDNRTRFVVVTR